MEYQDLTVGNISIRFSVLKATSPLPQVLLNFQCCEKSALMLDMTSKMLLTCIYAQTTT